jgi:NAD+ synthase (glutamine-hydrolysing)
MQQLRVALVQMNPIVGDLVGNRRQVLRFVREARKMKADLVAFPELVLTGYPPEDLMLKPQFLRDMQHQLRELVREIHGICAVVGYVEEGVVSFGGKTPTASVVPAGERALFNAAAVIADRTQVGSYRKQYLPNYGVFDESRYFSPNRSSPLFVVNGVVVGINICEDIWVPEGPTRTQAAAGADVIVNINASPFQIGKSRIREEMLATRARENGVIITYTNMVGGQDELVFDGNSVMVDQSGEVMLRAKAFEEDVIVADLQVDPLKRLRQGGRKRVGGVREGMVERIVVSQSVRSRAGRLTVVGGVAPLDPLAEAYHALVCGVRDYLRKNSFTQGVIGLSGGIDSALTAVIAADAIGPEHVLGVFMPSPYTSRESREDVHDLVGRLGMPLRTISITGLFGGYRRALSASFSGRPADLTEENLQARIRGNLLMALSNKFGHLVLTTGNKSELSVGFATLYGDMAGGFAVIKDVPKTLVYQLAEWRNRQGDAPIPKRVFIRPPTAELRPNQKDEDSLPPYAILDPILKAYVEEDLAIDEIVRLGFDKNTVRRVIEMVDRSEYKRRQAPIGIKITHRAFGKDRRMPITNNYRNS